MKDMMDMPTEVMDHQQIVQVKIYTYCYQICLVLFMDGINQLWLRVKWVEQYNHFICGEFLIYCYTLKLY